MPLRRGLVRKAVAALLGLTLLITCLPASAQFDINQLLDFCLGGCGPVNLPQQPGDKFSCSIPCATVVCGCALDAVVDNVTNKVLSVDCTCVPFWQVPPAPPAQ